MKLVANIVACAAPRTSGLISWTLCRKVREVSSTSLRSSYIIIITNYWWHCWLLAFPQAGHTIIITITIINLIPAGISHGTPFAKIQSHWSNESHSSKCWVWAAADGPLIHKARISWLIHRWLVVHLKSRKDGPQNDAKLETGKTHRIYVKPVQVGIRDVLSDVFGDPLNFRYTLSQPHSPWPIKCAAG